MVRQSLRIDRAFGVGGSSVAEAAGVAWVVARGSAGGERDHQVLRDQRLIGDDYSVQVIDADVTDDLMDVDGVVVEADDIER